MRNIGLLVILLLLLCRCSFFLKKLYHIKNPQLETKESIEHYIDKKIHYILPFSNYMIDSVSLKTTKISIPVLEIYNKDGYLMTTENQNCNYSILQNALQNGKADSLHHISKIFSYLPLFNTLPLTSLKEINANYYFIVYWTKWSGKVSTNLIKEIVKFYTENSQYKLHLIFVNADYRKDWTWAKKYIK